MKQLFRMLCLCFQIKCCIACPPLFLLVACADKFLEKELPNTLTQESFPETPADALAATNAIYEGLRQSTYHRGFYPIDDILSDDARKGSNPSDQATALGAFDSFEHRTTSEFIYNWYRTLYANIRRANVVLSRVPEIANIDPALLDRLLGEARFLRALFYFDLARAFGGVALVTTVTNDTELTRSSMEATYDLIESDLRQAIQLLPEKSDLESSDLGRANKGAARALLSRAYLYQNQFDSAAFFAEEVIQSGQFQLEPVFENTYREAYEHGQESLFEIGGIAGPAGTLQEGANEYVAGQGVRGTPNQGFGFNRPSLDLIDSYEAGDPRLEATVIFLGEVIDGIEIVGDPATPDETRDEQGNLIEMETYNQKTWASATIPEEARGHNRRLIRYAEVLLNAAEAQAHLGNVQATLDYLEQVRSRAREGDPAILPRIAETDPDLLLDFIFEERRHELAMEGFRFWDLVRSGRAPQVLVPLGFVQGRHELLPIPQAEIDITQGRIEQNPGWD